MIRSASVSTTLVWLCSSSLFLAFSRPGAEGRHGLTYGSPRGYVEADSSSLVACARRKDCFQELLWGEEWRSVEEFRAACYEDFLLFLNRY